MQKQIEDMNNQMDNAIRRMNDRLSVLEPWQVEEAAAVCKQAREALKDMADTMTAKVIEHREADDRRAREIMEGWLKADRMEERAHLMDVKHRRQWHTDDVARAEDSFKRKYHEMILAQRVGDTPKEGDAQ